MICNLFDGWLDETESQDKWNWKLVFEMSGDDLLTLTFEG